MYGVDTKELKIAMAEAEIGTIVEFAEASGINRNTLSGILDGSSYPSSLAMKAIVETLNLEPSRAGRIFFMKKLT